MSELICPKCRASMRSYERNGVTIEQCTDCRGIFLDQGELERLSSGEQGHYDQHYEKKRGHEYSYKHKRKSFLGEIFDF